MDWEQGIVSRNPEVLNGDLVFAGTRVPVKNLVDYLAAGDSLDFFLEGFPGVSRDQESGTMAATLVNREQAVAYLEMSHKVVEETVGAPR